MKRILLCLFFITVGIFSLQAQTLIGKVIDAKTRQPIAKVSVYLNGTSVHTMTDDDGMFAFSTDKIINTDLIISHVAYNMVSIPNPYDNIPDVIYLSKKENLLNEVVVVADKSMRKEYLKAFRIHFLGDTKAGKSCKILNEDDIYLHYDQDENRLIASADNPVVIHNKYLEYTVNFTIVDFYIEYSSNPFEKSKGGSVGLPKGITFFDVVSGTYDNGKVSIRGTTSFSDLAPNHKKVKKRRTDVYKNSSIAFFKALVTNSLKEAKFRVFNKGMEIDPTNYFYVDDSPSVKKVVLIRNTDIQKDPEGSFKAIINILYDKKEQSVLGFQTDSFLVDEYGNINRIDKILFSGEMGRQRIGDMLPLNYEPEK